MLYLTLICTGEVGIILVWIRPSHLQFCMQTGSHYLWVTLYNARVKYSSPMYSCCCTETQMWSPCCRDKNKFGSAGALKEKPVAGTGSAEVALTAVWCYYTSKGMQNQMTPLLLDTCPSHCNLTCAVGILGPISFYRWASTPYFPHSFCLFSGRFVIRGDKCMSGRLFWSTAF